MGKELAGVCSSQRKHNPNMEGRETMQTSLRAIAEKAKKLSKYRFQELYSLLNANLLTESWKKLNKKAAPGVDGTTADEYAQNLESNIQTTVDDLKNKRYHAKLVKRVYIPKGEGKLRPLGLPVTADKVVQRAVADILEAIYEQDFLPNSYGYRPNRGPQMAVIELTRELQFGKYNYIVEADIRGYFNNIDHEWLVKMLEQRIDDQAFIRLIRKWLNASILETDGKILDPITGTPQGGIVSPVLANICLHYALDLWFEKVVKPHCEGRAYLCRYADDFACAFQYKRDAERFYEVLGKRLNKFSLELAPEKTRIIQFGPFHKEKTSFEFLGFEFRWGLSRKGKNIIKRRTSRKKLRKSVATLQTWCKEIRHSRQREIFYQLSSKLRGYFNYYGIIGNSPSLLQFYGQAMRILYKWLNRRSQRSSLEWEEFKKLWRRFRVPKPRIVEGPTQLALDF
ncbi:group II intron reverse transcriptase/maturase [Sporomusa paucivorans]|uniref:group II intron reverse transcriptase/maturase n=1 Tax=Sporomusa paucivorans TaxID=2376 RepID=UPI003570F710